MGHATIYLLQNKLLTFIYNVTTLESFSSCSKIYCCTIHRTLSMVSYPQIFRLFCTIYTDYCKSCLVTDGSTGDELDSDGDLSTGVIRKKSSKKSRTRSK